MNAQSARGPDKRIERSRSKVLAETYRQLTQSGIGGVSIDAISRHSGVSKTTIYRHWPSRAALLMEACASLGGAAPVPDTGSLRGDLLSILTSLADQLEAAPWSRVYPSILDAAERDAGIAALQNQLHRAFMAPIKATLERAAATDASLAAGPTGDIIASLVGPLFFRRWFSHEAIDADFIAAIVDLTLGVTRG